MTELTSQQQKKLLAAADIVEHGDMAVLTKIMEFQDFLEKYQEDKEQMDNCLAKVEELKTLCSDSDNEIVSQMNNALTSLETTLKSQITALQSNSTENISSLRETFNKQIADIKASIPLMPDLSYYADRLSEIEQKIPIIKETILDNPIQLRDKLETLLGDERLDRTAIKGLDSMVDQSYLDGAIEILDKRTQYLLNKPSTSSNTVSGSGTVTSVATDATLTGGTITTTGTLGLNLANANTWTAAQTIQLTNTQLSLNYDATHTTTFKTDSGGNFMLNANGGNVNTTASVDFAGLTSATGQLRLFRLTNTSGALGIGIFKGDGTSTIQAYISGNSSSYMQASSGVLTIGSSTNGGSKFNVAGSVSIGATYYTSAAPSNGMIVEGLVGFGLSGTPNSQVEILTSSSSTSHNQLTISNSSATATSPASILLRNSSGTPNGTARIYANPGSSYTASNFTIAVADSSKVLQDRLSIDVNGNTLLSLNSSSTAVTQSENDNSTKIATTAYVDAKRTRNQLRIIGQGLVTETYPIATVSSNFQTVSQTVYYNLVGLLKGDVITNIHVALTAIGTTTTSVFVALYDSSGNRLAVSNDLTTALDSTLGMKTLALSSPYTITSDGAYYLSVLIINGTAGNCPTLQRGNGTSGSNGAVGSGVRAFAGQAGQSTMPTTASFSNATVAYWMGAS